MTNRFFSPDQQFVNNAGVPLSGGFLYFYATGTSTPQNTYSDRALTIANTNPVVLDSNGQAGSIFMQNLAYKVVLTDSNNNQIWTMDPVYTSDYSTYASVQPVNGNPNGQLAGTASTVGALPPTSMAWDYTNRIMYVCTLTGSAATAQWTAINAASATGAVSAPQGYLTLSSDPSLPITTGDASGQTSIYYTPYIGNQIPVYNGSAFGLNTFSQLTLSLTASQAANAIYDVFVFNNSGVLTLVTGPAWTNSTAGLGARGTGAGTTQIQRLGGLWVNAVQITGRNGATSYTIAANVATYVGSIYIDNTAGQVSCVGTFGRNRKWGVWNAYNRVPIYLTIVDGTASWTYASATIRASNNTPAAYSAAAFNVGSGTACNGGVVFCGLPEERAYINFRQVMFVNDSSGVPALHSMSCGIGVNSTTVLSGQTGTIGTFGQVSQNPGSQSTGTAAYVLAPQNGTNNIAQLESANPTTTNTYYGTFSNMAMVISWNG